MVNWMCSWCGADPGTAGVDANGLCRTCAMREINRGVSEISVGRHQGTWSVRDDDRLVRALRNALVVFPELRLGQLLVNATGVNDLFYVPDDALVKAVERYTRDYARERKNDHD